MIKKFFTFFINLIMSFLVLIIIFCNLILNTVYSKNFVKQKLAENSFYERSYSDIVEVFEENSMSSGLDLSILDNLISKEKVINDINKKIDTIYGGNKEKIETESIRNELDLRINNILKENNRKPTNNEKKSIKEYEDAIVNCYKKGILYDVDFILEGKNCIEFINICCICGVLVLALIIIIINKSIFKYISCLGVNLLFSGILCVSVKFLIEKRVVHILLLDAKFSKLLVNSLIDVINIIYEIGLISVGVGFVLSIIGNLLNLKKTIENKND